MRSSKYSNIHFKFYLPVYNNIEPPSHSILIDIKHFFFSKGQNSKQQDFRRFKMRWVLYLSIFITLVTLACCMISICIPYWLYTKDPQLSYQGLWQRCTPVGTQGAGDNVDCELILLPPEFLDATRVMMLFGMSLYIFATICSLVYIFCRQEKTSLITAATFLMLFGGILCMIGVIVYGAMYPILLRAKGLNLHAGFALGVCSVVGGFLNTLFYCMARAKGDVE